jgi:hypothetical protein
MIYTPHQSSFVAHRITPEELGEDALAQSLSTARVAGRLRRSRPHGSRLVAERHGDNLYSDWICP